jgi:hypothetical protein
LLNDLERTWRSVVLPGIAYQPKFQMSVVSHLAQQRVTPPLWSVLS